MLAAKGAKTPAITGKPKAKKWGWVEGKRGHNLSFRNGKHMKTFQV